MTEDGKGTTMGRVRKGVGEGLVIVVSILLAFGVDASWDRHVERQSLTQAFAQLHGQLDENRDQIKDAIALNGRQVDRLSLFVASTPERLSAMPTDSLELLVSALLDQSAYDQNGGVVEGFVRDGRLDLVTNPELRGALMLWSTLEAELAEDYAAVLLTNGPLRSLLVDHGVIAAQVANGRLPGAIPLRDAVRSLREDPRGLDFAVLRARDLASYNRNLEAYSASLFEPLK